MKNILIMANYSNSTGFAWNNIYRLFSYLADALGKEGIKSFISFPEIEDLSKDQRFFVFEGAFLLRPGSLRVSELRKIRKVITENRIEAIYLTDQPHFNFAYALYRLWGVKRIIVHSRVSVASPDWPSPDSGLRGLAKWCASRTLFIGCDRIYAVSEFVKHRLVVRAKVPRGKIRVILNGIDTKQLMPSKESEDEIIHIYSGGRATLHKGFQFLFEAIKILVQERKIENISVKYAGDGPDLAHLMNIVHQGHLSDHVKFLGEASSTYRLQSEADIVVVPSIWGDACPSAVAEALAAGKPLVATSVGGIPEMIGDSSNALLVPHSDAAAIADALERLIEDKDLRIKTSLAGRRRAETALNLDRYHRDVLHSLWQDLGLSGDCPGNRINDDS